jgi:DNA-binding IclR family transcriptional regulator
MAKESGSRGVQSAAETGALVTPMVRGLRLLEYIAQGGSTGNLSEVGRLIDVNRVTVMRLLATLEQEGMIERLSTGGHRVSLRFLALSATALGNNDFMSVVRRYAQSICRSLGVSVYYTVFDDTDMVYLLREMPPAGLVSHITLGSRVPAWQLAPGKAVLACFSNECLGAMYGPLAQGPIPDFTGWMQEIKRVREQGYAWSRSGLEQGINACAAAIFNATGSAYGALSVVGPERVFKEDSTLELRAQRAVCEAALALSKIKKCDGTS